MLYVWGPGTTSTNMQRRKREALETQEERTVATGHSKLVDHVTSDMRQYNGR